MAQQPLSGSLRRGPFELSYQVEGTGPAALVIGSARYYPRIFSAALRHKLRLAFIDHRGFGRALGAYGPGDAGLDQVLADTEALRQHLGLGRCIVIGHSGHGYMALEYAKRFPAAASHVVMIATGPSHSPADAALAERHWQEAVCPERKARFAADMAGLPALLEAAPERRFISFCLAMAARSWFDPGFDAAPLWADVSVNMPVIDQLWGEAFRDLDISAGLDQLSIPVLLALGRCDYLVAPAEAWAPHRAAFRDLTMRIFEQSSHTPPLEQPVDFDAELLGFLGL